MLAAICTDIFDSLFGEKETIGNIIAAFVLVYLGIVIHFLVTVTKRDVTSERTPTQFDPMFLMRDNQLRFFKLFFYGLVGVMFGGLLIQFTGTAVPVEIARMTPLIVGIIIEKLIDGIVNKFS